LNQKKEKIPLLKPYFDSEELEEISEVLNSCWVSQGPKVKEFEKKIESYLGVKYAIAVSNCTSALHLSLLSLGIKKDNEVLVSDYTFPATGHAVLYCDARPVFIDIDSKTYNIDIDLIEGKITEKTKAIVPVHIFGQPVNMHEIMHIAKDHNLKVIEDAACALGARYKKRFAGTFGNIGCFSFHARKGITTGEGGMVVTNDSKLEEKIRYLSVFGIQSAWDREQSKFIIPTFNYLGYNYKMSDITAAVGVAQLKKLDKIIKRKQNLAKYWTDELESLEYIKAPFVNQDVKHVFQSYVGLVDKRINRNKLIESLNRNGLQTQIGTYACHIQPVYRSNDVCPVSLDIFNRSIALPMYYRLDEEDIDNSIKILKKSLKELK
jgi:dTDP-4-amino-4,6-dideoxygalactose transaminase